MPGPVTYLRPDGSLGRSARDGGLWASHRGTYWGNCYPGLPVGLRLSRGTYLPTSTPVSPYGTLLSSALSTGTGYPTDQGLVLFPGPCPGHVS